MFAIANECKSLWQWDLNQQLTVAGDCTEVHYLDRDAPSTLTVAVKDGKADIPNILLQKAGRLVVYAYIIDEQDHHTKVCETFGIAPRPKPAEYVYTETEVKTWSDLQSQIGDLADLATDEKGNLVAAINEAAQSGGGGGAGAWYVTLTPGTNHSATADKTAAEVYAAYEEGKAVYCFLLDAIRGVPVVLPLLAAVRVVGYLFCFAGSGAPRLSDNAPFSLTVTYDGTWHYFHDELVSGELVNSVSSSSTDKQVPSAKCVYDELQKRNLKQATSEVLGGVKADPATADDTQPVRIDDSGKLVTAPAAVSDTQVSSAVSTWLTEHPEATTTLADGSVTDAKLSDDLYKQITGDSRHKLTEIKVTPVPESQRGSPWVKANFDGTAYNVVTTFFTPFKKTPQYIKCINKSSDTTIELRSGHRAFRFANGTDESADGFATTGGKRNLQFFANLSVAPGETLFYDLQEYGRRGCEFFQFIIGGKNIGGAYTDDVFSQKLEEIIEVYYVYDSYVPLYSKIKDTGEFLYDLPIKFSAQGINDTSSTRAYGIVPYYPNFTYNVRGGVYANVLVNSLSVLYLLDDKIFEGRDKGIDFNSGDCGHVPLIKAGSTTQYDTSVNGGEDSKYQWAYITTPPETELRGVKYVAIPLFYVSQDDATDKGSAYYNAIFDAKNAEGIKNLYITRFDKQVPRSLYAQLAFPNPDYHDDGSKYYAMLTSASKSPLVGAKWTLFGDSLTDNYGGHDLTGSYFATKIAREFNMSFDNRAKSGSNIYRGGSGNYVSVSGMIKLDEFIAEIEAGTTEQPDYITIAFGTNSFAAQIGTNEDTSMTDTSVYGATKRFIEVLRAKCPKSVFGFVLPPKQNWGSADPSKTRAIDAARTAIKTVCDNYGVPYIDMSTQSGITVDMLPDGIHISNDQSQNLYYHAMRRFMIGL